MTKVSDLLNLRWEGHKEVTPKTSAPAPEVKPQRDPADDGPEVPLIRFFSIFRNGAHESLSEVTAQLIRLRWDRMIELSR